MSSSPQGVVAVFVVGDRVVASTSDFSEDRFSGFDTKSSQDLRARQSLSRAILNVYCSPVVADNLSVYQCAQVVHQLPGEVVIINVGYESEGESE